MFDRLRTRQGTDRLLGKPAPSSDNPWVAASPNANRNARLRQKAKKVAAKQARFTRDEQQELLAAWVQSNE